MQLFSSHPFRIVTLLAVLGILFTCRATPAESQLRSPGARAHGGTQAQADETQAQARADRTQAQPGVATAALHLLPRPEFVAVEHGCRGAAPEAVLDSLSQPPTTAEIPGGAELVKERFGALGIRRARHAGAGVKVHIDAYGGDDAARERYRLVVDKRGVNVWARTADGAFDAFATLAQLPVRAGSVWTLPCVQIADAPALRWRILSDDVSRGPLPTMRYFKERIRTIASFKMNGYSPYMEHVFVDPKHPLPAPLDGITSAQLRELDVYARRFHVAFVPEQQTFAHMHETLKYERYAPLAELPHGYLLSPGNPAGEAYAHDLIADELRAVPHPPFFHIGSDEPSDLGRGLAQTLVESRGEGPVYAQHVVDTANFIIARGGGRPMIWDDALARHPELFATVPKSLVFINWHYGAEKTYQPYIDRIAKGGFDQMVAPGALNWNEIYPDLDAALGNIDRFASEGKASHVLGLFQTVWHDDGETLFEATWYPVVYAAASAWEAGSVDRARYAADFPHAFFGSDDPGYAADLAALAKCRTLLHAGNRREYGDYLFWADPFEPDLSLPPEAEHAPSPPALKLDRSPPPATKVDDGAHYDAMMSQIRLSAEGAMAHLRLASLPPLHANAVAVMAIAARRYDLLGRNAQIAKEARFYYDDARANADGKHDSYVYRGLFVAKYLFWEQRDAILALEPQVRNAWEYENRRSHETSVLERYHVAAGRAIERADRISDTVYRDYVAKKTIPPFDVILSLSH